MKKSGWIGLSILVGMNCGCAPRASSQRTPARMDPQFLASDVDPQRAALPLEQIEPVPAAPPASTPPAPLAKRSATQLAAAERLLAEQRYADAAAELEKALRYDPNHPLLHRMLATIAWSAGNLEAVRTHAGRAIELNPNDVTAYYLLGRAAAADGRVEDAIREYRLALVASPIEAAPGGAALAHYYLAGQLDAAGYLSAALSEYRAYERIVQALSGEQIQKSPDLGTLVTANGGTAGEPVSLILERLGRFNEAAAALAEIMARSAPGDALRARYARLLSRAGRHSEALAEARKILDNDQLAVELLLELHERAGNRGAALNDLRAMQAAQPDRALLARALADALLDAHQPEE
ncbi:MAG TPA: tetratricopeptide repeat protein, partial [Phycisphaerae bacterium]